MWTTLAHMVENSSTPVRAMTVATLLNAADPAFDFEHRSAHRTMLQNEGVEAGQFSALPYLLDPNYGDRNIPAGWANTLHTQAHADFIGLFPAPYGNSPVGLNDIALRSEPDAWWQFSNHQLHYIANQVAL